MQVHTNTNRGGRISNQLIEKKTNLNSYFNSYGYSLCFIKACKGKSIIRLTNRIDRGISNVKGLALVDGIHVQMNPTELFLITPLLSVSLLAHSWKQFNSIDCFVYQ